MTTHGPRLLVVASPGTERAILDVFDALLEAGGELVFGWGRREGKLPAAFTERERVSSVVLPLERHGRGRKSLRILRQASNTVRFFDPSLEGAEWARVRAARHLLKALRHPDWEGAAGRAAAIQIDERMYSRLAGALRDVERLLPPPPDLQEGIAATGAGALLIVSRLGLSSVELDTIKAARALGLPSVLLVWSWDNLSSKATLTEHPDHVLVWNELQAHEAETFHRVDPDRVHVVGAANFDRFFDAVAAGQRPPAEEDATLLYLGSSPNVASNEAEIGTRWVRAVRASDDPRVRDARIVVRPHPADHSWDGWAPPDDKCSLVPSRKLDEETLSELLLRSSAVVALNTSAELEAAIAGKPVVTFRAAELAPGQEGSLHFRYLLADTGGFVVDSRDLDEHVRNLSRALAGEHDADGQRAFVERFLRPHGLDRRVAPQVAAAILELAR